MRRDQQHGDYERCGGNSAPPCEPDKASPHTRCSLAARPLRNSMKSEMVGDLGESCAAQSARFRSASHASRKSPFSARAPGGEPETGRPRRAAKRERDRSEIEIEESAAERRRVVVLRA